MAGSAQTHKSISFELFGALYMYISGGGGNMENFCTDYDYLKRSRNREKEGRSCAQRVIKVLKKS